MKTLPLGAYYTCFPGQRLPDIAWAMSLIRNHVTIGCLSRGTLMIFVWAIIGQKYLNGHISAKNEDIEL